MTDLAEFVKEALSAGRSREEIRQALAQAGWPEDEINEALSRFADVPFPIPVPRRHYSTSAQEAFLYLVTFVALYIVALSAGSLFFGLVDHWLPDPVQEPGHLSEWRYEALRRNIASVIVAFPIYLLLTRMHLRQYVLDPERRRSVVRRWLTYLTLFVATTVIIGALISLIANALSGEMPVRFLLKVLAVLAIALAVLGYYRWELREPKTAGTPE